MDYKATLNLPKTDFQMKAELSKKEPEALDNWEAGGLYKKITEAGLGRPKYILHDGPPYANGNIHIGHALNKILKDFIVKSRFMDGYATDYVPGWDCHGLPIELQVEKELGKKKEGLSKAGIRKRCRSYAEKFVDVQRAEFKRLGVFGLWDEPYLTMEFKYQATILRELGRFAELGILYKRNKPVNWCPSCRTALAEAEVEYADKTSPSVFVKFQVDAGDIEKRLGIGLSVKKVFIVIWTTTPWTLPANLAIALGPEFEYSLLACEDEAYIVSTHLLAAGLGEKLGWHPDKCRTISKFRIEKIEGLNARHPFIDRDSVVLPGEHVTLDAGTGCVHIAPGHGQDDYELGLKHDLDIYAPVDDEGKFTKDVPEFAGQFVFKANEGIIELLKTKEALLKREDIQHSYPCCWRCKNKIIFRATEQWFASMEAGDLRKKALSAIDNDIKWIPAWGRDRIYNMIEGRPDWCLSRQRAWGVPIPAVKCSGCGHSFIDKAMAGGLAAAFEKDGADIWFEKDLKDLAPSGLKCPKCGSLELKKEENILDVWFDSGVSFAAVLEKRDNLKFPADLYLEGSDQHRGWFHSSLLASIGARNTPPYKAVLTHGFVVDGEGKKMSKSLGNVIAPQEVISKYGAEILRLWVAAEDYREDIRISEEILKRLSEAYRRIRNTFRYMLGNLYDFDPAKDTVDYNGLEEIDKLILHRLTRLTERVLVAYERFEFHAIYHSVHNFCTVDLSAFYLDIIKDRLYTSPARGKGRRAAQTAIYHILDHLVRLTAPVLVFTSDEAWSFMPGKREESVHLSAMPKPNAGWIDDGLEKKWDTLMKIKAEISKALEAARERKIIGHSLDAQVAVSFTDKKKIKELIDSLKLDISPDELKGLLKEEGAALEEILIISAFSMADRPEEAGVFSVAKADGQKCERCWHYSTQINKDAEHPAICPRCAEALR